MPASTNAIRPSGGRNHIQTDYISPRSVEAPLVEIKILTAPGGTQYFGLDAQNLAVKVNTINELTAAAGVTIDSVLLKDGTARLTNNTYLQARNAANNANVDIVKINASDAVEVASASGWRTALGLGTIATQAASGVAITGGSITGITDLAVADGGTGASTASGARTNLSAAESGSNSDITNLTNLTSATNDGAINLGTTTATDIQFTTNNVSRWNITSGGILTPLVNVTYDIGTTSLAVNDCFVQNLRGPSGGNLSIRGQSTNSIAFITNGVTRCLIDSSANLRPNAAAGANLGTSTEYWNGVHLQRIAFQGTHGNGSQNPASDAPSEWAQVLFGATTYYIPLYT